METGPVGERVSRNLVELRGRLPVRRLSERLSELGRPILPSGITKIEKGERRVDVDDLVALALALNVSPNRLLLDREADDVSIALTETERVTRRQGWEWATGAEPISDNPGFLDLDAIDAFRRANRPNEKPDETPLTALPDLAQACAPIAAAVDKVLADHDIALEDVVTYLEVRRTMDRIEQIAATKTVRSRPRKEKR